MQNKRCTEQKKRTEENFRTLNRITEQYTECLKGHQEVKSKQEGETDKRNQEEVGFQLFVFSSLFLLHLSRGCFILKGVFD